MNDRHKNEDDVALDLSYADGVAELDQILDDLEGDDVDIDVLAHKVRRAASLVRLCRDRVSGARLDVEQIVADLNGDAEEGGSSIEPP